MSTAASDCEELNVSHDNERDAASVPGGDIAVSLGSAVPGFRTASSILMKY